VIIITGGSLSGDPLVANGILYTLHFDAEMRVVMAIGITSFEGLQSVDDMLTIRGYFSQADGRKSIQLLVEIQLARTDLLHAETVHLESAVRQVIVTHRNLYNYWLSLWVAISVDHL
jgi:hypothetical protein